MLPDSFIYKKPVKEVQAFMQKKPESYFCKRGENMALKLFYRMSEKVPAYKNFLKVNRIDKNKIKSVHDLTFVPPLTKKNYLNQYSIEEMAWDGNLTNTFKIFSTTSGTTGKPFYFPRDKDQKKMYSLLAELYLTTNFNINKKSTLYINGFAMGPWIGGLFTYEALEELTKKNNYKLSLFNAGVNAELIVATIQKFRQSYQQILLAGYPPFIKEVVELGSKVGINWKKGEYGFIFSAEPFTESFRDFFLNKVKTDNLYKTTLNHYGTVDQGTHAYETPYSIFVRRMVRRKKEILKKLFGKSAQLPTLAQYIPEQFYFESDSGSLFCSSYSGLPLVRYDLKDRGGILSKYNVDNIMNENNLLDSSEYSFVKNSVLNLPFVYVFERKDMVVSFYGANIYPEHIREAHILKEVNEYLTGRFVMQVVINKSNQHVLVINSELKNGIKQNNQIKKLLESKIIEKLLEKNSEYKNNYRSLPSKNKPKVKLSLYGERPHFNRQGKQKWVINS